MKLWMPGSGKRADEIELWWKDKALFSQEEILEVLGSNKLMESILSKLVQEYFKIKYTDKIDK